MGNERWLGRALLRKQFAKISQFTDSAILSATRHTQGARKLRNATFLKQNQDMKKFIYCKLFTQSSELMTRYKLEYSGPLRPVLSTDVLQQAALLVQQQHLYNILQ